MVSTIWNSTLTIISENPVSNIHGLSDLIIATGPALAHGFTPFCAPPPNVIDTPLGPQIAPEPPLALADKDAEVV